MIINVVFLLTSAFFKFKVFDHVTNIVTSREPVVMWAKTVFFKTFLNKLEEESQSFSSVGKTV